MKRKKRIEKILSDNFRLKVIEVFDISSKHKGHNQFSGSDETHFSIILHQNVKDHSKKIDIHRKINYLLKEEYSTGLHALEIKIKD